MYTHSDADDMKAKAKGVHLLHLNPRVPTSPSVFIESGMPSEVDYF